jgi:hypothetical protein
MIYVGIDNGLDGGIVALSDMEGLHPIASHVMPTRSEIQPARKKTKAKKLREVDAAAFLAILNGIGNREDITVIFEQCPFRAERASTMRSMAMSAGKLLGVMETRGIRVVRILSLDWQPVMLGKVPQGQTKAFAIRKAREIWPKETWIPTTRHRVPHDGLIDAALIAEFGRRRL